MEEVGRQHQGMDRHGVRQVPEGSEEQGKMEKTDCKLICGAPTTLAVKEMVMMMMMMMTQINTRYVNFTKDVASKLYIHFLLKVWKRQMM